METAEFRRTILQNLLQLGSENYKENTRILGVLDDKAQKTGAVAGAFLAAGFAFLKPENLSANSGFTRLTGLPGLSLLALSVGLLLACTILALVVMWTRSVPKPLSFAVLEEMTLDLMNAQAACADTGAQENFLRDQSRVWKSAIQEQEALNKAKARHLEAAQLCLTMAIMLIALLLLEIVCKTIYYRPG